ncbi:hypothetical protein AMAG_18200 [Allomyces macrogynus ATCC 38327]|uniref:Uncharacterized protein n=1 Tax=Allomyces macrogynus (strain ATCC 38327) TaxID=578462 RepID=A0A0L0SAT5_ALLM3|nr:hypothetical protein AMAG_18200 [Allomyces macrogynus ATCC 38327]|eukprot:KNE59542.1 hypothetical protein AMAG_18200 [Allomyces macrogynus ATCC 38327]
MDSHGFSVRYVTPSALYTVRQDLDPSLRARLANADRVLAAHELASKPSLFPTKEYPAPTEYLARGTHLFYFDAPLPDLPPQIVTAHWSIKHTLTAKVHLIARPRRGLSARAWPVNAAKAAAAVLAGTTSLTSSSASLASTTTAAAQNSSVHITATAPTAAARMDVPLAVPRYNDLESYLAEAPVRVRSAPDARVAYEVHMGQPHYCARIRRAPWGIMHNDATVPDWLRAPFYRAYSWLFNCQLHEMVDPDLQHYPNLGAFFYREIDLAKFRPYSAKGALIMPSDGTLIHWGAIDLEAPKPKPTATTAAPKPAGDEGWAAEIVHGVKGVGYKVPGSVVPVHIRVAPGEPGALPAAPSITLLLQQTVIVAAWHGTNKPTADRRWTTAVVKLTDASDVTGDWWNKVVGVPVPYTATLCPSSASPSAKDLFPSVHVRVHLVDRVSEDLSSIAPPAAWSATSTAPSTPGIAPVFAHAPAEWDMDDLITSTTPRGSTDSAWSSSVAMHHQHHHAPPIAAAAAEGGSGAAWTAPAAVVPDTPKSPPTTSTGSALTRGIRKAMSNLSLRSLRPSPLSMAFRASVAIPIPPPLTPPPTDRHDSGFGASDDVRPHAPPSYKELDVPMPATYVDDVPVGADQMEIRIRHELVVLGKVGDEEVEVRIPVTVNEGTYETRSEIVRYVCA